MTIQYQALLRKILGAGVNKGDRTGTGTRSLFGAQLRFDLREGFPLLTTKKLPFRWIAEELFWLLSGSTNEGDLRAKGVDIWKEWATEEQCARFGRVAGDLGPIYGHAWRNFGASYLGRDPETRHERYANDGVDQIANALELLRNSPDSRRILVTGWNPREATEVALPPCHTLFQFGTHEEMQPADTDPEGHTTHHDHYTLQRVLSCHMYQRSADVFLGVPFNIASYALLTHLFAHVLDYKVGTLTISFGDVHIYNNHREQVQLQLGREPRPLPRLAIDCDFADSQTLIERLLSAGYGQLTLSGYDPHKKIRAEVSV